MKIEHCTIASMTSSIATNQVYCTSNTYVPTSSSNINFLGVDGDTVRVTTIRTPASAAATGLKGEICWDSGYLYICVATNTWQRVATATW
jgi:homoaconitase/3-isopropylmalate dehydratase large subunit